MSGTGQDGRPRAVGPGIGGPSERLKGALNRLRERFERLPKAARIALPIGVALFLFEVGLVATLQAFIFATLTAIYLGGAVAEHH